MARGPLVHNSTGSHVCGTFALAPFVLVLIGGCAGGRIYEAVKLPPELVVAPTENAQSIDLSRLAKYSGSTQLIDCGDLIEVTIQTGYGTEDEQYKNGTLPVRVGDDGIANVPPIGKVTVAGLEPEAAERSIAAAGIARGIFRNPSVTVVMRKQRMNRITVVGAVEKPGLYELPRRDCSLLGALVEAGGLSKEAGVDVEIRRASQQASGSDSRDQEHVADAGRNELASFKQPQASPHGPSRVNLVSATKAGSGGVSLDDGDVVMVEKRDVMPVQVMGLVNKPGQFDLPANKDLRALDSLALAGGLSTPWANKVHIIRQSPNGDGPAVIEVSIREAKRQGKGNLRLAPGDIVSVEQTPTTVFMETLKNLAHFSMGASVPVIR